LPQLAQLGRPLLVGLSRKSMLQQLLGRGVDQRLAGSLALAMQAVQSGARIIRAHDVAATVDVIKIVQAVRTESIDGEA
jgi:dihydropteroate synthase